MHRAMMQCLRTVCLCTGMVLVFAIDALAQSAYPVKPIRVVLGFPAGTNVDILARPVAARMSEALGQQVVVDNRPGATGLIANELVAKGTADGGAAPAALAVGATRERADAPF